MALTQVKAAGLTADLIDETKLADNSIDSEHYNDGSIDHEHLADDAVDGDIIADNAVGLAHMAGGTDGVIITYDASGNPVHVGPGSDGQVLTSTGPGSPPAFENASSGGISDIVSDTSPQLGGDLDTNSFEISLDDDHKVKFGDGSDLQIYHAAGTINRIDSVNEDLAIRRAGTAEDMMIKCVADGSVELYEDGVKKFETTSGGAKVTGELEITSHLEMGDGDIIKLGDSDDLQLYHDGSHSHLTDGGTGDLKITANDLRLNGNNGSIKNYGESETFLTWTNNGAVAIYHNNVLASTTQSDGFRMFRGAQVFGDEGGAAELLLYADEGDDHADMWRLAADTSGNFSIGNFAGGGWETNLITTGNGNLELYYDGSKKLETNSTGVHVTGMVTCTTEFRCDDNEKFVAGTGQDLQIYHDGTDSYIDNGTGATYIRPDGVLEIKDLSSSEVRARYNNNGSVELFHNGNLKFYTDGSGSGTIVYDDEHSSTTSLVFRLRKNASGTATDVRQHMFSFSVPGNNRGLAQSGSSATEAPIWAGYSDYRVKTNFRPYTGGWDAIKAIPVQLYDEDQPNYAPFDPASNQTNKKGWKAHEVQAVMPEAVTGDKDAVVTQAMIDAGEYEESQLGNIIPQYLGTTAMIPTIIGALQQAMTKIETLETKVAALEAG